MLTSHNCYCPLDGDSLLYCLISSEVEKDLAKRAEQGKLNRSPNSPHRSSLLTPSSTTTNLFLCSDRRPDHSLPAVFPQRPQACHFTTLNPQVQSWAGHLPATPARAQTPSGAWTPSRPLTPNSLMMHSLTAGSHGNKERVYGRSRSRPVTPTGQITRPILTPPGLSTTDLYGGLWSTLTEVHINTPTYTYNYINIVIYNIFFIMFD